MIAGKEGVRWCPTSGLANFKASAHVPRSLLLSPKKALLCGFETFQTFRANSDRSVVS